MTREEIKQRYPHIREDETIVSVYLPETSNGVDFIIPLKDWKQFAESGDGRLPVERLQPVFAQLLACWNSVKSHD